jgi:hypothetical protein
LKVEGAKVEKEKLERERWSVLPSDVPSHMYSARALTVDGVELLREDRSVEGEKVGAQVRAVGLDGGDVVGEPAGEEGSPRRAAVPEDVVVVEAQPCVGEVFDGGRGCGGVVDGGVVPAEVVGQEDEQVRAGRCSGRCGRGRDRGRRCGRGDGRECEAQTEHDGVRGMRWCAFSVLVSRLLAIEQPPSENAHTVEHLVYRWPPCGWRVHPNTLSV